MPDKRILWAAAFLACLTGIAAAETGRITRLEALEAGVFEAAVIDHTDAAPDASGPGVQMISPKLADGSMRVPGRLGVNFGIRFRSVGRPKGGTAELRSVLKIPEPGVRNPATGQLVRQAEAVFVTTIGAAHYRGYSFLQPWEIVTGDWVVEIWSGDKLLMQKTFTIYQP